MVESEKLDDHTYGIFLEVPGSKVVHLQAYFEIHEGVGTVRTMDIRRSLVCILTTTDMLDDCIAILTAIRKNVPWRDVSCPDDVDRDRVLGYFKG